MEKNNDKVVKKVTCDIVESSFVNKDSNELVSYFLLKLPIADGLYKTYTFKTLGISSFERKVLLDEVSVVSK